MKASFTIEKANFDRVHMRIISEAFADAVIDGRMASGLSTERRDYGPPDVRAIPRSTAIRSKSESCRLLGVIAEAAGRRSQWTVRALEACRANSWSTGAPHRNPPYQQVHYGNTEKLKRRMRPHARGSLFPRF